MKRKVKKGYKKPKVNRIKLNYKELVRSVTPACPYVYVWRDKEYYKETNILPQSENLTIKGDRLDYYIFQTHPSPKDGFVALKLKEIGEDVSYFNSFKLLTLEYPQEYNLAFDEDNKPVFFKDLILPLRAYDYKGKNRLKDVTNKKWSNPPQYFRGGPGEGLEVEFPVPDAKVLNLVIIDPHEEEIRLALCTFGNMIHCLKSIHIHIDGIDKNFILNTRSIFYPDVISLTPYLSLFHKMGKIKVRIFLTSPHKISLIGLSTAEINDYKIQEYHLRKAFHSSLKDVTDYLIRNNSQYVSLFPEEELELYFTLPALASSPDRKISYVLVSRGFYLPIKKILNLQKINEQFSTVNV